MRNFKILNVAVIGRQKVAALTLAASVALLYPGAPTMAQSGGGGGSSGGGASSSGGGVSSGGASAGGTSAGSAVSGAAGGGASPLSAGSGAATTPSPTRPAITSAARSLSGGGAQNPDEAGLAQENNWDLGTDPSQNSANQGGGSARATQATATAGQTNLNSINAGTVATSGNPNTASSTGASTIGGNNASGGNYEEGTVGTTSGGIAGAGRPEDFRIPTPPIGVNLVSIRNALTTGASATPDDDGN